MGWTMDASISLRSPIFNKEWLMINEKKIKITLDDIWAVWEPLFNTGDVLYRSDLVDAIKEAYPNLSPRYFELVGSETWKTVLYDRCNIVLNLYKNRGRIRRVGRGEWQSTSVKSK